MNIVFPELDNPTIKSALTRHAAMLERGETISGLVGSLTDITALAAPDLDTACEMVTSGEADTMIAGIDYSSRDVILACREHFAMAEQPANYPQLVTPLQVEPSPTPDELSENLLHSTFSGLAVMRRDDTIYLLADMAACKHPTEQQLAEIITQTHTSARRLLADQPRVALLSFSTAGSGGRDDTITLLQSLRDKFRDSDVLIDGEMQLDAAINPTVAAKKFPSSPVAGRANVLIAPDLNTGNILYKAFEQLAGFQVAGPILQGFAHPISDLSRGSTVDDVILTIEVMARLAA